MGEGLNSGSVMKMADFSKEKAKMGRICQRGEKGDESSPRLSEEPKGCRQKYFFWGEGESSAYKGFCLHNRNRERSVSVLLPELVMG